MVDVRTACVLEGRCEVVFETGEKTLFVFTFHPSATMGEVWAQREEKDTPVQVLFTVKVPDCISYLPCYEITHFVATNRKVIWNKFVSNRHSTSPEKTSLGAA